MAAWLKARMSRVSPAPRHTGAYRRIGLSAMGTKAMSRRRREAATYDPTGDTTLPAAIAVGPPRGWPLAERGEPGAAAGPLEQGAADPALLLLDRLADPRLGDPQAFGGASEVELFGQRQEDLDVA
jgi:hypothetical protein